MKTLWSVDRFDSSIFGIKVGKLWAEKEVEDTFFKQADAFFVQEQIKLVFCYAPFDVQTSFALQKNNYYLVSTRALYRQSQLSKIDQKHNQLITLVDTYQYLSNTCFFAEIARDLAIVSHYAKDPFIPLRYAISLYDQWIHNTYHGYAQQVWTALDENGKPVGFISLKKHEEKIIIDLLAVHQKARGQGIASLLLSQACALAQDEKKPLYVSTQVENIPAVRLYEKNGFLLESIDLVYHKKMNGE